ncbi:protein phosphatase 1 regulatory subunit 3A [Acomys russatus]|uniref:protein phosphatase 1 regulatory subunit 3A n=1 Tax=Acomys russatus TaxID=60746 RepID=UPI0021E2F40F|nr:protein phosphatase 1 regulatory subunit 3A [Acomys russatus]
MYVFLNFSSKEESLLTPEENKFENLKFTDTYIPTIICSHEDKDDLGGNHQNVKDIINKEHDKHNEKELDLMINQQLITSRDEKNTFSTDPANFTNKAEGSGKRREHCETHTDLFRRPLSPSSSPESSLKRDFYHSRNYSPGNEYGHLPSEEILSEVGEIEPLLGDARSDELMQSNLCSKEVLDDNANPAHGSGRVQTMCSSSDQLTAGSLKNNEAGVKKPGIKDYKHPSRDFCLEASSNLEESNASSKDDCAKEKEQKSCLGVNENPSKTFQAVVQNQERQMGHPKISIEGAEVNNQDLTSLLSKDAVDPTAATKTKVSGREEGCQGTNLEPTVSYLDSPRNGNDLTDDYLFQAEQKKSDSSNLAVHNMNTQHKNNWNVLERQPRGIESNMTEHIKEQPECKDLWEKRANTGTLRATPTEQLFTCQETECHELSSLADHGIAEKAQAVTAYIIKTTLERTPESMPAGGKAIIAKLPQETARSDKPIEVKETAFDPHEGRKDDSHYPLCHGDAASVIHDNDFERESRLDICNVRVDELEKEETTSTRNPRKTYDKENRGIGCLTSTDEPSQVITGTQKATSKLDLHLGVLPTDRAVFPENTDLELLQELSRRTDINAVRFAFNSDAPGASQGSSQVYRRHSKKSEPSHGWPVVEEKAVTNTTLQSTPTKSEYNRHPESEILARAVSNPEDGSKFSEIIESDNGRERSVDLILQQNEGRLEKPQGPMILISEPLETLDKARLENEGLMHYGQPQCSVSDKGSVSSISGTLPAHEVQAQGRASLLSTCIDSKVPYFLLFLIFLAAVYYYDLMIGLAFYLFSLYWLYWEGGRQRESVKKK